MSEEQAPYQTATEHFRRIRNFDELAEKIEPFAQSLALLADDMREASSQTIKAHEEASASLSENISHQWESMAEDLHRFQKATKEIEQQATKGISQAVAKIPTESTNWWLILACLVSGLAVGMGASWHLLKPSEKELQRQEMGADLVRMYQSKTTTDSQRQAIREVMNRAGWNFQE